MSVADAPVDRLPVVKVCLWLCSPSNDKAAHLHFAPKLAGGPEHSGSSPVIDTVLAVLRQPGSGVQSAQLGYFGSRIEAVLNGALDDVKDAVAESVDDKGYDVIEV